MQVVVIAFGRVLDLGIHKVAADPEAVSLDGPELELADDSESSVPFGFCK